MIGSLSILVVSGSPVREQILEALHHLGHTDVEIVGTYAGALHAFLRRDFRLIITNEAVGQQTGLDLLDEIAARWDRTPGIIVTQGEFASTRELMFSDVDWLAYPLEAEELRASIEALIAD